MVGKEYPHSEKRFFLTAGNLVELVQEHMVPVSPGAAGVFRSEAQLVPSEMFVETRKNRKARVPEIAAALTVQIGAGITVVS